MGRSVVHIMKVVHVCLLFFLLHLTFSVQSIPPEQAKKQRIDEVSRPKTFYGINLIHNSKDRPRTAIEWREWKNKHPDSEFVEFFFICHSANLKDQCKTAAT